MVVVRNTCLLLLLAVGLVACNHTAKLQHLVLHASEVAPPTASANSEMGCCAGNKEARCVGSAYCNACTSCKSCAYCTNGGSCGVCGGGRSNPTTPTRPSNSSSPSYNRSNLSNSPGSSGGSGSSNHGAQVSFWTDIELRGEIRLYLDGEFIGVLDTYFDHGVPRCDQTGTLTVTRQAGEHSFQAKYALGKVWNGKITFGNYGCTTMLLSE